MKCPCRDVVSIYLRWLVALLSVALWYQGLTQPDRMPTSATLLDLVESAKWQEVIQRSEQLWPALSDYERIEIAGAVADAYVGLHRYAEAVSVCRQALSTISRTNLVQTVVEAGLLQKLGNALLQLKDPRAALPALQRALELRRALLTHDHPQVADTYNNLGLCHFQLGDYQHALIIHEMALDIRKASFIEPHTTIGQSLNNIGLCLQELEWQAQAMDTFRRALAQYVADECSGQESTHQMAMYRGDIWLNMGNTNYDLGHYAESRLQYQAALKDYQEAEQDNAPAIATALNNLGNACFQSGDIEMALIMY